MTEEKIIQVIDKKMAIVIKTIIRGFKSIVFLLEKELTPKK